MGDGSSMIVSCAKKNLRHLAPSPIQLGKREIAKAKTTLQNGSI